VVAGIAGGTRTRDGVRVGVWGGYRTIDTGVGRSRGSGTLRGGLVLVVIPLLAAILGLTSSHADITSDPHAAALLSHHPAQGSALGESGELLGTVDMERLRLDLEAVDDTGIVDRVRVGAVGGSVHVLGLLDLLEKAEAQSVLALVSHGQIRKDEVAGRLGSVQVHHARDGRSGQHGRRIPFLGHTTVGHGACVLQAGE